MEADRPGKIIKLVNKMEQPCSGVSEVTVYTANFKYHSGCMEHCEKIGKGRSPPVQTLQEWEWLKTEVHTITSDIRDIYSKKDIRDLSHIWLASTDQKVEGEWRNSYPPNDLMNTSWAWPWDKKPQHDTTLNCLLWFQLANATDIWNAQSCTTEGNA